MLELASSARNRLAKVEREKMNKNKIAGLAISVIVIGTLVACFLVQSTIAPQQSPTKAMDFTVTGTNSCLRFLNETVSVAYVPFTVAANQQWQLTVNCTKMPGGPNGYTDIYVYNGYWDNGTDHKCLSSNIYPILNQIHSADFELKGTTSYTATFGESTQKSYTVFFVLPPGGQATFHITYKQA